MGRDTHIFVIPFPLQGHINPMLELAKRLISKGDSIKVTLITTNTAFSSMHLQTNTITTTKASSSSSINVEAISDGYEDGNKDNIEEYLQCFETFFPQNLAKLIEKHRSSSSSYPVKFIVYDSLIPWILKVARRFGLDGAPFFTNSCSVTSIYYLFQQGRLATPSRGSVVSLPMMPLLRFDDLPGFIQDTTSYPCLKDLVFS